MNAQLSACIAACFIVAATSVSAGPPARSRGPSQVRKVEETASQKYQRLASAVGPTRVNQLTGAFTLSPENAVRNQREYLEVHGKTDLDTH